MSKCPTCGYQSPQDLLKEIVNGAALPEGVGLYDFGDGVTTMPMWDSQGGTYLTKSVAFLWKPLDSNRSLFLRFEIPHLGTRPVDKQDVFRAAVLNAIKSWPDKAAIIVDGQPLPALSI